MTIAVNYVVNATTLITKTITKAILAFKLRNYAQK